jgi:hypothetical protein
MRNKRWLLLPLILFAFTGKGQHLFLEFGGNGGLGSLNFEKRFLQKEKLALNWRLGFSLAPIDRNNGTGIVLPVMVNGLYGRGPHFAELGLGEGFTVTTRGAFFLRATGNLSYRYQHPDKRITFRAGYTPIVSHIFTFQWQHWAGVSVGYQLNKP